jgi:hypothetical protein
MPFLLGFSQDRVSFTAVRRSASRLRMQQFQRSNRSGSSLHSTYSVLGTTSRDFAAGEGLEKARTAPSGTGQKP